MIFLQIIQWSSKWFSNDLLCDLPDGFIMIFLVFVPCSSKWSSNNLSIIFDWFSCDLLSEFLEILEAASNKTAFIQPITSHLANHPRKMSKIYWALLVKHGQTRKQCSPMDSYTWIHYHCHHYHAVSEDFLDPLSPLVSIIHLSWQVFQVTSCIGMELL